MRRLRIASESGHVPAMPRALLLLLSVIALVGGCAQGPPPRVWAASVCSALTPWRAEIASLTSRAQQLTPQSATPDQAKENLLRMLEGAQEATEQARVRVSAAGVPEVEDGAVAATGVLDSLTKVRDAYRRARDEIQALPTGDPEAFYAGVADAMQTLQQEYAASSLDTHTLRSTELQAAFAEAPECH